MLIERGLINFPPLKRGGGLFEREGLIEDFQYLGTCIWFETAIMRFQDSIETSSAKLDAPE